MTVVSPAVSKPIAEQRFFIVGGAGFIGSHFCDRLLADGIVADSCVTCPLHGWRFDLLSGERQGGEERVRTFAVRERDGLLELQVDDEIALAA